MQTISEEDKIAILGLIRVVIPGAEYAPEKSFRGKEDIRFEDQCGCYSEYTTDACSFTVYVQAVIPKGKDEYKLQLAARKVIRAYVTANFVWYGCENCDNELFVDVRLFPIGE